MSAILPTLLQTSSNSKRIKTYIKGEEHQDLIAPPPSRASPREGLNFEDVLSLLQQGELSIQAFEVESLFDGLKKSLDDKVQLFEMDEFLHAPGGGFEHMTWRQGHRLRKAYDAATSVRQPGKTSRRRATHVSERDSFENLMVALNCQIDPRCRFGKFELGHFVKKLAPSQRPTPGPGDYAGDSRFESRHKTSPAPSFGTSDAHDQVVQRRSSKTPGPGSYSLPPSPPPPMAKFGTGHGHRVFEAFAGAEAYSMSAPEVLSRYRLAPAVSFGLGPGHGAACSFELSSTPGPDSYNCKYDGQAHVRRSTAASIRKPVQEKSAECSPGPAAYDISTPTMSHKGKQSPGADRFCKLPLSPFDADR